MVDRDRAVRHLDALRAALSDLDRYATDIPPERLKSDADAQNMVLHAIYRAVQSAIDLALAARLAGWAGLRNIIAHSYLDLDYARVHAALAQRGDLRDFATQVATRLGRG